MNKIISNLSIKKISIVALLLTTITSATFMYRHYSSKVCIEPLVSYNQDAVGTGMFLCFSGKNIDKSIDDLGFFDSDIKLVFDLLDKTANYSSLINQGKIDLEGVETNQAMQYIKAIHNMWKEITEITILFSAKNGDLTKYIFSGNYRKQKLVFQVETSNSDENIVRLRVIRSKNEFSKLLARWHVHAGKVSDEMLRVGFWERVDIMLNQQNVCVDESYCLYFSKFEYQNSTVNDEVAHIWGEFLQAVSSGEKDKISGVMDELSAKNLGVLSTQGEMSSSYQSLFNWFSQLNPIASLHGENFFVLFVRLQESSDLNNIESYQNGEGSPIFFYKNNEGKFSAIELNQVNTLTEFFKKTKFN